MKIIRLHARPIEIPCKSTLTISYGSEDAAVATLAEPYQHEMNPTPPKLGVELDRDGGRSPRCRRLNAPRPRS
ncbi:MAG: hypothetical protein OXH85_03195 [Truepera sp.]|nr:hypothetical protein [Truepera sp.]